MIDQFDRLRKRNAFIDQYKKEKMFENGLEEFDDARCVSSGLHRILFGFAYAVYTWIERRQTSYLRSIKHARARITSHT